MSRHDAATGGAGPAHQLCDGVSRARDGCCRLGFGARGESHQVAFPALLSIPDPAGRAACPTPSSTTLERHLQRFRRRGLRQPRPHPRHPAAPHGGPSDTARLPCTPTRILGCGRRRRGVGMASCGEFVGWLKARQPSQVASARAVDLTEPVRHTVNRTVVGARDRVDVLVPRGGGCNELCRGLDA